jgi:hypothetical protein
MERPFEIVPSNVSRDDLVDESNRRSARAGYCSRSGERLNRTKIMTIVPFGKTRLNLWPRDKRGNLIGD